MHTTDDKNFYIYLHTSAALRMERLFNNKSRIFRAPAATVLLINVAMEVELGRISQDDFMLKVSTFAKKFF